ncbi:MAG: PSD1 and planctomycete cytochrome C domain-containing protein [Verrucomicrobiota bacterium]
MNPILTVFTALVLAPLAISEAASPDFQKEVFPVLEKHCVECHGPKKQKSALRVDSRAALIKGGDFGAAVVPGDPVNSHLLEVITTNDKDSQMPPKGERLSAPEIEALRKWIAQGAVWPGQMEETAHEKITSTHWAFQPLATHFAHDSLDGFVRAGLVVKSLVPSGEADRRTLIRRVTLDLTGLPPKPEEVEAFVNDRDANAFEKLAERLLRSPRYGERWAQHWLDVIRYADTRGYEYNTLRETAWPFRDWVIDALNNDLSYEQFLFQQIAGDTLGIDPATGFLVTAPLPTPPEVGQEPTAIKAARFNALDEIIQNIGASMLGLTVGCARCHNHKFDPIPMRDYYRIVSVFSGVQYDNRPWRKEKKTPRLDDLKKSEGRMVELRAALSKFPQWREVSEGKFTDHFTPVMAKWVRMTILSTDATSEGPAFDEIEVWSAARNGVAAQQVGAQSKGGQASSSGVAKQLGSKDEFLNDNKVGNASTWVAAKRPPAWVQIELAQPCLIDRLVWSRDRDLAKSNPTAHAKRLTSVWRIEVAETAGEWRTIVDERRSQGLDSAATQQRREMEEELETLSGSSPALRIGPEVFAGKFAAPELINVLMRGDPQQPRDPVGPGSLSVLDGFELPAHTGESERRIAFAKWLTKEAAPLTARVAVNRVWHHHFGSGLVDTPSDFGMAGSRPVNQPLLDWLAREFIASGWSLKHLHKLIVTSAAYRQRSEPEKMAMAADAGSRLLWRFPPRRLDAETIHDSMLSISGSLNFTMGGPGVNIYKPKGSFDQWKPKDDLGPESWRRMIYLAKMRGADDGMFKTFDLPDCGQVRAKRSESTTPLQALNLLNGRFVLEQATQLSKRLQRESGANVQAQIRHAFALTIARPPTQAELAACTAAAEADGLETVCRALFNSNEFLMLQ